MKRFGLSIALTLSLLGIAATPALAQGVFEIGDEGSIIPRDRSVVIVPVRVECSSDAEDQTGTVVLTLEQEFRGSVVTGTGQTSVTCDGVARTYPVAVTSEDGQFRRGTATVSGELTYTQNVCIENPEREVFCNPFTVRVLAGPEPIQLHVGR